MDTMTNKKYRSHGIKQPSLTNSEFRRTFIKVLKTHTVHSDTGIHEFKKKMEHIQAMNNKSLFSMVNVFDVWNSN
jgi:hypothetical protein